VSVGDRERTEPLPSLVMRRGDRNFYRFRSESCQVACRSVLPYQLSIVLRPSRVDPE
jgi:hypothetical protein